MNEAVEEAVEEAVGGGEQRTCRSREYMATPFLRVCTAVTESTRAIAPKMTSEGSI